MRKYTAELKAKTGEQLKQLYKDTGKTQRELAADIGRKESFLSAIANGSAPMTDKTAAMIHEVLPDYSVEYLVGDSPYRNEEERKLEEAKTAAHDWDLSALGFGAYSELCGFTLTRTTVWDDGEKHESGYQQKIPRDSMIIARDGKSVTVPFSKIEAIQDEVRDFVDFKLSRMLNR